MKTFSMLLGRFQTIPPHEGHQQLVRELLLEGKNILILLRKEDGTDKNPYTLEERSNAFKNIFKTEIEKGRIVIQGTEDVTEVCYGRTPGWSFREIVLPDYIQKISATEFREQKK